MYLYSFIQLLAASLFIKFSVQCSDCLTVCHGQKKWRLLIYDVVSRQHLRSASRRQLVVLRHRLSTFGRRAFAVAGPMSWNSLPNSVRESACDDNISDDCFKHSLKTL